MKPAQIIVSLVVGLLLGWLAGSFLAREHARLAILAGPYSDNYGPVLSVIADAKAKLHAGDTNIMEQLLTAETQIRAVQDWSKRFLGQTHDTSR